MTLYPSLKDLAIDSLEEKLVDPIEQAISSLNLQFNPTMNEIESLTHLQNFHKRGQRELIGIKANLDQLSAAMTTATTSEAPAPLSFDE